MGHQLLHVSFCIEIYGMGYFQFLTVRSEIIYEIQIVRSEVHASKGGSWRDGKASGPAASQRGIEVRGHGQRTGEGIVQAGDGDCGPDYIDGISRLVGWVGGLA